MEDFLRSALLFVNEWNFVFYGVGVLGALLYFLRAREANRIRRYTPFPIEREEATAMLRDSLIILTILIAILATTFYIDRILLPSTPNSQGGALPLDSLPTALPTSPVIGVAPSLAVTATVEGTATSEGPVPTISQEITATTELTATVEATPSSVPTPPPEPTATPTSVATLIPTFPPSPTITAAATPIPTRPPEPTTPPVPAANCNTPGVRITSPAHGQVVSGNVSIFGTADIDRFQFYKVEFGQGGNPGSFAAIGDVVRQPVREGFLASWAAGTVGSGIWTLRLTVVDATGNFPPPCDIRVIVP